MAPPFTAPAFTTSSARATGSRPRSEGLNQLSDVRQCVDRLDRRQRRPNPILREHELRAVLELRAQVLTRERVVRAAAIAIVGRLHQLAAVDEIDLDDAPDLVKALLLDSLVADAGDALHHLLR